MKSIVRFIATLLPFFAIVLVVCQVVVSNKLASHGKRLAVLDSEIRLEKDILAALHMEVASASSLLALREKAQSIGFSEPTSKQILTLTPDVPVALGVLLGQP